MPFKRGQLRSFITVAEEGQMTRAAAKLHIAQPALSQAIAHFESELGFRLLERHARGVTLTPAGETFLEKARLALAAATDAALMAESLARAAHGTIEFGFLGYPPGLDNPALFDAFAKTHPDITLRYHELRFPHGSIASWLAEVDIALCHPPPADSDIWVQPLRIEPRVVLAPKNHPLAGRGALTVAEVLDETFISLDPSIEPTWAGFWSLDDHRGAPPRHTTTDHAASAQELFATITAGRAITTIPACHAEVLVKILPDVAAIPLHDAEPSVLSLLGRKDRRNKLINAFLAVAESFTTDQSTAAA